MKTTLPKYQEIDQALQHTTLKLHPAQVHGVITGLICADPNNAKGWEELVTGQKETKKTHDILQLIYEKTAHQLSDFLFEFQLILPSDRTALPDRAEALTLWCQGFLTGLKLKQIPVEGREQSEMTEAIDDIIEIAKMNYEEVVASEEDEAAFMELVEYVRMAAILIYQDLQEANNKKGNSSKQLH